jgi:hypothetical protein
LADGNIANLKRVVDLMKILRVVGFSAILALAPLATAKLPVPYEVLGQVEGALDFCSHADPQSSDKYQEKKKAFTQGASEKEVAEARASKEYKENYDAATEEMGNQPKEQTKKTCAAALEGKSAE